MGEKRVISHKKIVRTAGRGGRSNLRGVHIKTPEGGKKGRNNDELFVSRKQVKAAETAQVVETAEVGVDAVADTAQSQIVVATVMVADGLKPRTYNKLFESLMKDAPLAVNALIGNFNKNTEMTLEVTMQRATAFFGGLGIAFDAKEISEKAEYQGEFEEAMIALITRAESELQELAW